MELCRLGSDTSYHELLGLLRPDTFGILIDGPFAVDDKYKYPPKLRVVVSTEFDQTDVLARCSFTKENVNAAYDDSRAELALGLALAVLRNIAANDVAVRAGQWIVKPGNQLSSLSVGVFSNTSIGDQVASLLSAFSKTAEHRFIDNAIKATHTNVYDLVCIIDDVGDQTLSEIAVSSLKDGGFLVDVSRFPAFPGDSLQEWVGSGRLSGAATIVGPSADIRDKSCSNILFAPTEVLQTAEALNEARMLATEKMLEAIRQEMSGN